MKRKSLFPCLLCVFTVLCILSCDQLTKPPPSPHLYAQYYVRYLAAQQQVKAEVQFAEGDEPGKTRPKTILGGVNFMGEVMEFQPLQENYQRYSTTFTAVYPDSFSFQYVDDSSPQSIRFDMAPIVSFYLKGPVVKGQALELVLKDSLLLGNESLTLLFSDEANRAFAHTIRGPTRDTLLVIPDQDLPLLPSGPGSLYLVKRMEKIMEQNQQTITAAIEYYTDTIGIHILE